MVYGQRCSVGASGDALAQGLAFPSVGHSASVEGGFLEGLCSPFGFRGVVTLNPKP